MAAPAHQGVVVLEPSTDLSARRAYVVQNANMGHHTRMTTAADVPNWSLGPHTASAAVELGVVDERPPGPRLNCADRDPVHVTDLLWPLPGRRRDCHFDDTPLFLHVETPTKRYRGVLSNDSLADGCRCPVP